MSPGELWDLRKRACLGVLSAHVGLPAALAVSPDGSTLLTGGRDQVVNLWSLSDLKLRSSVAVLEAVEALVPLPARKGKQGSPTLQVWPAPGQPNTPLAPTSSLTFA